MKTETTRNVYIKFLKDKFPISMKEIPGYGFLLPGFLFMFIYMIYPLFKSFYLSFTQYNFAYDDVPKFIGLDNFIKLFSDSYFISAFKNTMVFTAIFLPSIMIISLAIALLLNRGLRGTNFFRTSIFLPVIVPLSLTGVIFQWILHENYGLVNYFLKDIFNLPFLAKNWLTDDTWAMYSIIFVSLWKFIGIEVILFVAGLQAIPRELYEAARVDGANSLQTLVHITLPNLKETYVITGIWAIIQSVKVFEQPFIMTQGGPGTATLVLYQYVWQNGFEFYEMGYASAIAYVMGALILVMSLINLKLNNREV